MNTMRRRAVWLFALGLAAALLLAAGILRQRPPPDQDAFAVLALTAPNEAMRAAARTRLVLQPVTDQAALGRLALLASDDAIRGAAYNRLTSSAALLAVALDVGDDPRAQVWYRPQAVAHLTDPDALLQVARGAADLNLRLQAGAKLATPPPEFRAALFSPDPTLRRAAASLLTDEAALGNLVVNDPDREVRVAASYHLQRPSTCATLATTAPDPAVRVTLMQASKNPQLIARLAMHDPDRYVREQARGLLTEPPGLAEVAEAWTPENSSEAQGLKWYFTKLSSQALLERVARQARDERVRRAAEARLLVVQQPDQAGLAHLAASSTLEECRWDALEALTDQAQLAEVAITATDDRIRPEALRRMTRQGQDGYGNPRTTPRLPEALLAHVATASTDYNVAPAALADLSDPTLLRDVAGQARLEPVRAAAAARLALGERPVAELLATALTGKDAGARLEAERALRDPAALVQIACLPCKTWNDECLASAALARLDSQPLIAQVAASSQTCRVVAAAAQRLTAPQLLADFVIAERGWPPRKVWRVYTEEEYYASHRGGGGMDVCDGFSEGPHYLTKNLRDSAAVARVALLSQREEPLWPQWTEFNDRSNFLAPITDADVLLQIALGAQRAGFRRIAVARLTDLPRLATCVCTAPDPTVQQLALLRANSPALLRALAWHASAAELRRTAILLLDDQVELQRLAQAPDPATRSAAVLSLDDDTQRLAWLQSPVTAPALAADCARALRRQDACRTAALHAYYTTARAIARARLTDLAQLQAAQAAEATLGQQTSALRHAPPSPATALQVFAAGSDQLAVARALQVQDPAELQAVAEAAHDPAVLAVVLPKLSDASAWRALATAAKSATVRLAASHQTGTRTWAELAQAANAPASGSPAALRDLLDAMRLTAAVVDAAAGPAEENGMPPANPGNPEARRALQQVCLELIARGDERWVPALGELLPLCGDRTLAEDFLNCGREDVALLVHQERRWFYHRLAPAPGGASQRVLWGRPPLAGPPPPPPTVAKAPQRWLPD